MRKQKSTADLARAAGDKVTEEKCNARIGTLKAKYNDLTEKCGLTPMRERMRVTLVKPAPNDVNVTAGDVKPLTNAGGGGIMQEKITDKPITKITDEAIARVPEKKITGYTAEQSRIICEEHKKLLEYARNENGNEEVAFVFFGRHENKKRICR